MRNVPPSLMQMRTNRSAQTDLIYLFFLVVIGAYLGQWCASMCYGLVPEPTTATTCLTIAHRKKLLILQAMVASSAFIIAPLLYLRLFAQQSIHALFQWTQSYTKPLLTTLGLVATCMAVNTWVVQWNMAVKLPVWLNTFEIRAREMEAIYQKTTALLTTFSSLQSLVIGVGVMGLIPAIGEELLFRGIIQNNFYQLTHNAHLAICSSALIFSMMHLQLYGLLPRFLLGALFGYIYWWTQDLRFPIVAHFFNNSLTLLMLFLHQQGVMKQHISHLKPPHWLFLVFFTVLATIFANRLRVQCNQPVKVL